MVKETQAVTLAIGDGGNDVNMIQEVLRSPDVFRTCVSGCGSPFSGYNLFVVDQSPPVGGCWCWNCWTGRTPSCQGSRLLLWASVILFAVAILFISYAIDLTCIVCFWRNMVSWMDAGFKFLRRLLFVHGHDSYHRTCFVAQSAFYKNICIALMQLLCVEVYFCCSCVLLLAFGLRHAMHRQCIGYGLGMSAVVSCVQLQHDHHVQWSHLFQQC